MTHPVIHHAFIFPEDNTASFYQRMKVQAETCFLMADLNETTQTAVPPGNEGSLYTIVSFIFTVIHIIMIIPSTVLVHMLDLFALLTTICCWRVVNKFLRDCKRLESSLVGLDDAEGLAEVILDKYDNLKAFINNVNNATGLVFLCCIGISLPFYASFTAVLFFEEKIDWFETIHFYVYFITFLIVLTLAANINKKANEFYDWISTSPIALTIHPNQMTLLMMDLYSNRIALSGCGVFSLTFRFFVTILSIIVTYTSIIVQLQISRRDATLLLMGNSTRALG
ncbi:uncharacterized protein LOC118435014 [Folsomia candida]|nr:uncharacterized protein LOC118435014 [Folsomia candida]